MKVSSTKNESTITTFSLFRLRITAHFIPTDLLTVCNLCYCGDNQKKKKTIVPEYSRLLKESVSIFIIDIQEGFVI